MKLEKQILDLLKKDSRLSHKEISVRLGSNETKISALIKKLEDDGVIARYSIIANEDNHEDGREKVRALIEVQVKPEGGLGFENVAKRVSQFPNVVDHYLLSGTYDFLIVVEGDHIQEVSSFVSGKLSSIENIKGTVTHFILKKYKVNGAILDQNDSSSRLLVSP